MKPNSILFKLILILCCSSFSTFNFAGILAERTRVIYPEAQREVALMLNNTNDYSIMTQVWVDDGTGNPDTAKTPFLVLSPMFKLNAGQNQGIRILENGTQLPKDRETLYWLNLYEVPMLQKKQLESDYLRTSTNTQLKLIYRPKGLPELNLTQVDKQLSFTASGQILEVTNNSAHYLSFANLQLRSDHGMMNYTGSEQLMIEPKSSKKFDFGHIFSTAPKLSLSYILIDDLGQHHTFGRTLN